MTEKHTRGFQVLVDTGLRPLEVPPHRAMKLRFVDTRLIHARRIHRVSALNNLCQTYLLQKTPLARPRWVAPTTPFHISLKTDDAKRART